jgi:GntR family transcriptional regulator/MocR family aminotransferase
MVPLLETNGKAPPATLSLVRLDAQAGATLQEQLVEQLRRLILERALRPGQRLPSTRALAGQLGVSRNTVLAVFEQLLGEGYVEGTQGSGTYVSRELPDRYLGVGAAQARPAVSGRAVAGNVPEPALTARAEVTMPTPPTAIVVKPFRPCIPSVAEFPLEQWERLRRRVLGRSGVRLLGYGPVAGDERLREQIALHLRDYRGVRCTAQQIVITAGAQQAFNLIGRAMGGRGKVWFEDPGYIDARLAFESAGLTIVPQPVDAEGLTIPTWRAGGPRLAYTTPSRQFPLGTTMSLARRVDWLRFASKHDTWVIEDDYDSEFRYEGRPLPSLQGLMPEARVVYVGTFSKCLFPALRMGYVVAPLEYLREFWEAKETADVHTPSIDQAVLAEFMREGHLYRHLRKMRTRYAERAEALAEAADQEWRGLITLASAGAGLNVAGWLEAGAGRDTEVEMTQVATTAGFQMIPLGRYALKAQVRPGFLLGFGAYPPGLIRKAAAELGQVWRTAAKRDRR